MNPREFYNLAENLAASGSPAEVRTAVSRAYYASFHVGVEILSKMGFVIKRSALGHQDVYRRLCNIGNVEVRKLGSKLGDLQTKRNAADYDLDKKWVEGTKTLEGIMKNAREIIDNLERLCSGPNRDSIRNAIRDWESTARARPSSS